MHTKLLHKAACTQPHPKEDSRERPLTQKNAGPNLHTDEEECWKQRKMAPKFAHRHLKAQLIQEGIEESVVPRG